MARGMALGGTGLLSVSNSIFEMKVQYEVSLLQLKPGVPLPSPKDLLGKILIKNKKKQSVSGKRQNSLKKGRNVEPEIIGQPAPMDAEDTGMSKGENGTTTTIARWASLACWRPSKSPNTSLRQDDTSHSFRYLTKYKLGRHVKSSEYFQTLHSNPKETTNLIPWPSVSSAYSKAYGCMGW